MTTYQRRRGPRAVLGGLVLAATALQTLAAGVGGYYQLTRHHVVVELAAPATVSKSLSITTERPISTSSSRNHHQQISAGLNKMI